ncbi:MAG: HAD family hydrolase [Deltaproteobacteria bacterium]|nr:HAD family hydrolase [Deltaproteobacteria bacterium]
MIKAIVFDFDGVLVESADIKTQAFRKLFSSYPDQVDEMVRYHLAHMGISRFQKFRHFYENILKSEYTPEMGQALGERFSCLVYEEVLKAPFVKGAAELLERHHREYLMFIASGTPQQELADIVRARGLEGYFRGIWGSPRLKAEILTGILAGYGLCRKEVVFVGDAETDMQAAIDAGTHFIARLSCMESPLAGERYKVADMERLINTISALDSQE